MSTAEQPQGIVRTDLQRHDLSIPGREVVQNRVEIGPNAPAVRHKHPGEEIIYVLEGSLEYQIEGQPPMTFHAGDALTVPAGVVHAVRNVGSGSPLLAVQPKGEESGCSRGTRAPERSDDACGLRR
jgi:quercetin dioxygenase-like cupin family protein